MERKCGSCSAGEYFITLGDDWHSSLGTTCPASHGQIVNETLVSKHFSFYNNYSLQISELPHWDSTVHVLFAKLWQQP